MRSALLTILLLILTLSGFSQFRNTTWVFDKQKVKKATADSLIAETDTSLVYSTTLGKWDTHLIFLFPDGTLTKGIYDLQLEHKSKKLYLDDYEKIRDVLTSKYGQPSTDRQYTWIDDQQKDNPAMHPYAVGKGDLMIRTAWKADYLNIELLMKGGNNRIDISIRYSNPFDREQKAPDGF